jgi:hypothetical protein
MGLTARHYKVKFGHKCEVNLRYGPNKKTTPEKLIKEALKVVKKRSILHRISGKPRIAAYIPSRQKWEFFC